MRYKEQHLHQFSRWQFRHTRITPAFRFRVPPSQAMPVLTLSAGLAQIDMMNYGFSTGRGRQMMARGENIEKLKTFKESFQHRRCLVLANGFYDSEDIGSYLQPWHIHRRDDETMAFAGISEERADGKNFCLASATSNRVVARVIDRMPVILDPHQWEAWLDPGTLVDRLKSMLVPYRDEPMEAYPVTRLLNKPGFDGPECIERVEPAQGDLGIF